MEINIVLKTPEDTYSAGEKLGTLLKDGDIVCLRGDLGAGKTLLTKGLAKAFGIEEDITSPTFVIVNEYYGEKNLYHFDVYRIEKESEIINVGFDDYLMRDGVVVIEWPEKIESHIPNERIEININYSADNGRIMTVSCDDESFINEVGSLF